MSYLTMEVNEINVIGKGWYNQTICYTYKLTDYDLESIGKVNRDNAEQWLCKNSGDFQSIDDFRVDIKNFESNFQNEENEYEFYDIMFPIDC